MGMFDSAYIVCRCPSCGTERERECQTKDTYCMLAVWRPGDYVDRKLRYINCCATCECPSGRKTTFFELEIEIDQDGKLTNRYKIIDDNENQYF